MSLKLLTPRRFLKGTERRVQNHCALMEKVAKKALTRQSTREKRYIIL